MDKFDRELQKHILSCCIDAYPAHTTWNSFDPEIIQIDDVKLSANIIYLAEHGLLTIREQRSDDRTLFLIICARPAKALILCKTMVASLQSSAFRPSSFIVKQ
ncbi:hypothetical protein AWN63_14050 [Klebsiella variicola]|nr:hypothetical protein AWN63_14050 [Klebsiella variicola]